MKNKKFLFLLAVLFIVPLSIINYASAATTATTTNTMQAVTVATVNVYNAKIDSQTGNTVNVSFDLTNRAGIQPQIKYAVMIIKQTSSTQTLIDEKVYNDIISLGENDKRHITATYTAPASLNGTYMLLIDTENESGFPFGITPVSQVTFTGSGSYLSIDPSASYLTVTQDATTTNYNLLQGVDIKSSENLILHYNISNPSSNDITAVPHIVTYYRDIFGNIVGNQDFPSITIPKNSTATLSLEIPKPTDPQAYNAVLTLNGANGNQISNDLTIRYVIYGISATIQNIVFNKQSYQKGDTAIISFLWSGSADKYGLRFGGSSSTTPIGLSMQIKDQNGNSCADPYVTTLTNGDYQIINIPITNNCATPVAIVTLADQSGTILANNTFTTASTTTSSAGNSSVLWIIFWIIILIAIAIIVIYYFKQKKRISIFSKGKAIMILLLIVGGVFLYGGQAKADTSIGGLNGDIVLTSNFKNGISSYHPGKTISVDVSIKFLNNAGQSIIAGSITNAGDNNSSTKSYNSGIIINDSTQYFSSNGNFFNEFYFIAPSYPRQYYIATVVNIGPLYGELLTFLDYQVLGNNVPSSCSINANPSTIYIGKTTTSTISWSCSGVDQSPNACSLSNDQNFLLNVDSTGSYTDVVPTYKNKVTYTISCPTYGYNIWVSSSTVVTVSNGSVLTPKVSITANPSNINNGGSSVLSWNSSNVDKCYLSGGKYGGTSVPLNSSVTVSPTSNTNYTIQCFGFYGNPIDYASVTVNNSSNNSLSCNLSASPSSITSGGSSTLSWTSNNAQSCSIDNNIGNVSLTGSKSITLSATTKYTLTCSNSGGNAKSSATITVNSSGNSINSSCAISSDKSQLVPPQSATLTWNCLNVKSGTCSINGTSVAANSLSGGLVVSPTSTTNYTISCKGLDGTIPTNSTKIIVSTTSIKEIAP